MKKYLAFVILSVLIISPFLALAQPDTGGATIETGGDADFGSGDTNGDSAPVRRGLPNLLGVSSVSGLVDKIVNFLLAIAAPIAIIMILIGAYQIMFAAGNSEKWKTGKNTIIYALMGYGIILISKGIILIIQDFLK